MPNDLVWNTYPSEADENVLAEKLNRPESHKNKEGFTVKLWGGAIHPTKNWIAWIDYYEKRYKMKNRVDCNYKLNIKVDDEQVFEWEVETYNPFFGAITCYVSWHEDLLVYIYLEKHRLYGVTLTIDSLVTQIELGVVGVEFDIRNDIVYILPASNYQGLVKRYSIPSWKELSPISVEDAEKQELVKWDE